jgi:hypothetical protein
LRLQSLRGLVAPEDLQASLVALNEILTECSKPEHASPHSRVNRSPMGLKAHMASRLVRLP